MNEELLRYLWKVAAFDISSLVTIEGDSCTLVNLGQANINQGADFLNAKIYLNDLIHVGNIEIDLKSSHWYQHKHHLDPNHNNTILHVVYESEKIKIERQNGSFVPELELKPYIYPEVVSQYSSLLDNSYELACKNLIGCVDRFHIKNTFTAQAVSRLWRKSDRIAKFSKTLHPDWDQLFWVELSGAFGGGLNGEAFRAIAQNLPYSILAKHVNNLLELESLIFGVSGLLTSASFKDEYPKNLLESWLYFSHKYELSTIAPISVSFLRLRPANFPTIRLAQLAKILQFITPITLLCENPRKILDVFPNIQVSSYWENHYVFDKDSKKISKRIGKELAKSIVVNSIIPYNLYFHHRSGRTVNIDNLIDILDTIDPEYNHIVKNFKESKVKPQSALETQGMIELFQTYCTYRKCIQCSIGNQILSSFLK